MKRIALLLVAACGSSQAPPSSTRLNDDFPPKRKPLAEVFDPPRPTLRLPRNFTPTRYTARLAIDPAQPTFEGQIAIDGNLDRASAVIWLHGKHLDVAKAEATDGTHRIALNVTAQDDLLEVRPAQPLAAGHWQLNLTYRGRVEQNGFDGAFVSKLDDVPYISTQFEATAARLVFTRSALGFIVARSAAVTIPRVVGTRRMWSEMTSLSAKNAPFDVAAS